MSIWQHAGVRDLAWCLQSPVLVQHCARILPSQLVDDAWWRPWEADLLSWLDALDQDTAGRERVVGKPQTRLGHYFEHLLHGLLAQIPDIEVLAHGLQLQEQGRTQGELDFLFRQEHLPYVEHWEVAVKFYLAIKPPDQAPRWIGPAAHDDLKTKMQRLFQHQLLQGTHPQTLALLRQEGHPGLVRSRALLKGWLFYPLLDYRRQRLEDYHDNCLNPHHLRGWWIHRSDYEQLSGMSSYWYIVPRQQWLAPVYLEKQAQHLVLSGDQLFDYLRQAHPPGLIAALQTDRYGNMREVNRGFWVDDQWPESTTCTSAGMDT